MLCQVMMCRPEGTTGAQIAGTAEEVFQTAAEYPRALPAAGYLQRSHTGGRYFQQPNPQ
jgi:hypothetical protein